MLFEKIILRNNNIECNKKTAALRIEIVKRQSLFSMKSSFLGKDNENFIVENKLYH